MLGYVPNTLRLIKAWRKAVPILFGRMKRMNEQLIKTLWEMTPIDTRIPYAEYKEYFAKQCGKDNCYDAMAKERDVSLSRMLLHISEQEPKVIEIIKNKKPVKLKHKLRTENSRCIRKNRKYYEFMRRIVLDRDKHKCRQCGSDDMLEVHHIVERCNGGTDDISNLITLCAVCHANKHKGQGVYKIMMKRIRTARVNV